ncbi:hypothetical protein D9758_010979 [Tetrapyrgos nigripes]|uniref:Uncharacterized protein n=1 Tax=Tetrapyrgos nigripes TaxID=182062 RepID=A0A8H5GHE6_9AGAR|nr:hypothetical protein D9758_010979 [Tetrapyrgos nigripes]
MKFLSSIILGVTLLSGGALGSIIGMECPASQAGGLGCGFDDPDVNNGNAYIFQCNGFNFVLFADCGCADCCQVDSRTDIAIVIHDFTLDRGRGI